MMKEDTIQDKRSTTSEQNEFWKQEDLEYLDRCPICESSDSTVLYRDLYDKLPFHTPGKWVLLKCKSCDTAYLNPRPKEESISRAYENYYTHIKASCTRNTQPLGLFRRQRLKLANAYRNYRFGTKQRPENRLGIFIAMLMPNKRAVLDAKWRHLPPAPKGSKLLDVGCGNGDFLLRAKAAGWIVVGIDPDKKAVEAARMNNLDVRHGNIAVIDETERFDGITLSHVIEHVHEPIKLLKKCYELLNPGGWIWIETPNINALGHRKYLENWRGLEPPRHLVLFSRNSLIQSLERVGFKDITDLPYRPLCKDMFFASELIQLGDIESLKGFESEIKRAIKEAESVARNNPNLREYLTIRAWKR